MKRFLNSIQMTVLLMILSASTAFAQTLFSVEIKGTGKPLILIPGLYCTGDVWAETVARYKGKYECHIVTLVGFGSKPANLKDHFLEGVKTEIIQYVKTKKLAKPVIMGHSLGGFLAFWVAADAPELFSGMISVDGPPFMPAMAQPDATVASSTAMAETIRSSIAKSTPESTVQYQKTYLPTMITDTIRILQITELARQSDAKTIGQVMYELFTTDLRPAVKRIECPVLMLGSWIAYKGYGATHDGAIALENAQLKGVKHLTLEVTDTARHFIFYDDPAWFFDKVDAFLKRL